MSRSFQTHRFHHTLSSYRNFPLELLASLIQEDLSPMAPSADRIKRWKNITGQAFYPPLVSREGDSCAVACPLCPERERIIVSWTSTDDQDQFQGFGERLFEGVCERNGKFNAEVSTHKWAHLLLNMLLDYAGDGCTKVLR